MSSNRYNNYEKQPRTVINGFDGQSWSGYDAVILELKRRVAEKSCNGKPVVICFELYPGVNQGEILEMIRKLSPSLVIDMEELAKSEKQLNCEFSDFMTDDRVFGVICHKKLKDFFEEKKLKKAEKRIADQKQGLVAVVGVGAGFLMGGEHSVHADLTVYCPITRWEIQLRYRQGMANWHCTNYQAPVLEKVKRGFFIEWRLADRYKKERYQTFDYVLETEVRDRPNMITGAAFLGGLEEMSRRPFRLEPYFDPGVWGGHWMQEHFGLDPDKENYAWSFDGVPEENCINLQFGEVTIKLPAVDLVFTHPAELLGDRVHGRFGAEFPIRFDLLDTMGGGNLSLQVHPLTEYIQDTFGMHYTQDESYYILDADETEETYVYLGVKNGVDQEAMARDLKLAEAGQMAFPAETYVNRIPVKKHDHILIPAGTVHCSGKNTMVLEISATPYIFTFKLWDWGRVGLDGTPRPIHLEHGLKNIQWDRDTDWVNEQIVHQETVIFEENGFKQERTGLHGREFIETIRYTYSKPVELTTDDSVHVINLVDGKCTILESPDGSFEPFELHYAETAIVPAGVKKYRIVPKEGTCMVITASVRR